MSDEEPNNDTRNKESKGSRSCATTKRKLPRISPSLILPTPKSDPSLHQGRVRTSPHVDGQFAAFVYIPVKLTEHTELKAILEQAIEAARVIVPDLKCDWLDIEDPELHISLTRPIYLRDYQREELKRATKLIAQRHSAFIASFASFAAFDNDERTRAFLGIEVGAGHTELKSLSDAFLPTLNLLHQKAFYSEPRFHASIAWTLPTGKEMSSKPAPDKVHIEGATPFLSNVLSQLSSIFCGSLLKNKNGIFEVNNIHVKIGKDVHRWRLGVL